MGPRHVRLGSSFVPGLFAVTWSYSRSCTTLHSSGQKVVRLQEGSSSPVTAQQTATAPGLNPWVRDAGELRRESSEKGVSPRVI